MADSRDAHNDAAPGTPPQKKRKVHDEQTGVLDVDELLDHLLKVRKRDPHGQTVTFKPDTMNLICAKARKLFEEQPMMLELEANIKVCGDIHGQYHDLLRIFETAGYPPTVNYLFLGDYVDRGKRSLETISLLFAYKIKYPENFFLLRGNHESPSICRIYGFYDECKQRYSIKLWKTFCDVFNMLPACAVIDDKVICMHGGLSQEMMRLGTDVRDQVHEIARPADIPDSGLLCDLLWADPAEHCTGFGPNDRGVSVQFGSDIVRQFLWNQDMDLVVRAHQVVEDGYEFFADRSGVTIFSAPNYCGEFDNAAAVLEISSELKCRFQMLRPVPQMQS